MKTAPILVLMLLLATAADARRPEPAGSGASAQLDANFVQKKHSQLPGHLTLHAISGEVAITRRGVLLLKTSSKIKTAEVAYAMKTQGTVDANGDSTSSGGGYAKKLPVNPPTEGSPYAFNLAADQYQNYKTIALKVTSVAGETGTFTLVNIK